MITISWSTINSYHICPLKVRHELEGRQRSYSWAMAYGECGHKSLNGWAKGEDWKAAFDQCAADYEHRTANISNWDGTFTDTDSGIVDKMQILDLLKKYTASNPKPDPSLTEMFLTRDLGDGILLTGRIDAMLEGKVIDYKFTKNLKYLSPIQAIIYAILTGGPCQFEYHAMVKARNPYCDPIPVPATLNTVNLNIVEEYIIKPVAKRIQLAMEDSSLWEARPQEFLCKPRYCSYWSVCNAHFE